MEGMEMPGTQTQRTEEPHGPEQPQVAGRAVGHGTSNPGRQANVGQDLDILSQLASNYPTAAEIMAAPEPTYTPELLGAVKTWKLEHYKGWGGKPLSERHDALRTLVQRMALAMHVDVRAELGRQYMYVPETRIIYIDYTHASIISTMHEFAHALLGPSELDACRWSVHLFKVRFPRSFQRLGFVGHCLVQQNTLGPGTYVLEGEARIEGNHLIVTGPAQLVDTQSPTQTAPQEGASNVGQA